MAAKPTVGQDAGNWGAKLNEFLDVSHEADGTLKEAAVAATMSPSAFAGLSSNNQASVTLANGMIVKFGKTASLTAGGPHTVTFDTEFPTAGIFGLASVNRTTSINGSTGAHIGSITTTQASLAVDNDVNTDPQSLWWMVIGY